MKKGVKMEKINVNGKYNIYIENNFENLQKYIKKIGKSYTKIYIITDENVEKLYIKNILKIFKNKNIFVIQSGEKSKNINIVQYIYEDMLTKRIDRKSLLIGLGGGVVGDIAGFVASTYMRGIDFLQIPTTLLAQVDSSVGGKVGIDFLDKKNIIGTFYNPVFVYININVLKSLPICQIENGLFEVLKYGYILDKKYLQYMNKYAEKIRKYDTDILAKIVYEACAMKSKIVSIDEREIGIRKILNFGHTFGHAIETETKFSILHGHAVGIGMLASLYISLKRGYIKEPDMEYIKSIIMHTNAYEKINIDIKNVYNFMKYDKKNENEKISIILIKKIGEAICENNFEKNEIIKALEYALLYVEKYKKI